MAVDRRAFADPRFLAAAVVLAANDLWWKSAHGSWVTGKVSDVAGLFVAGVFVHLILGDARRGRVGLTVLGLGFALVKTIPAVTAVTVEFADAVLPWSNAIVTDPTDLLAVPVLFAVGPVVERPIVWLTAPTLRTAGLVLAAAAAVATSREPTYGDDLEIDDTGEIVAYTYSGVGPAAAYQTSACRPSSPDECWRITDLTIEQTTDGGARWEVVWRVDPEAAPTLRAEHVVAVGPEDFGPRDIVATDSTVVASFDGLDTTVERLPDGTWSPPPEDFRALPRAAIALQGVVVVVAGPGLAATAVRRARGLAGWFVLTLVVVVSLIVALGVGLAAMHASTGLLPAEVFVAVPLLVLLIACGLALMEPARLWGSLTTAGRSMLAVVLAAGVSLPALPLLRWRATGSPGYDTATLLCVALAAVCALSSFLVGSAFTRAPVVSRSKG